MLRAVKTQGPDEKALAEYKKLKEMLGINPTLEKLILLKINNELNINDIHILIVGSTTF